MASPSLSMKQKLQDKKNRKFPKYILDDPYFELSDNLSTRATQKAEFVALQKKEFLDAIEYANTNILSKPILEWTKEEFLKHLIRLNEISGNALRNHICGSTAGDKEKSRPSKLGYRTRCTVSSRTSPTPYYSFNISQPWDIFSVLAKCDNSPESAANYIKWHMKFAYDFYTPDILDTLEDRMVTACVAYGFKSDVLDEVFDGVSLQKWHQDFFAGPGKKFLPTKGQSLKEWHSRAWLKELYTKEEQAACDRVVKFFPLPEDVPKLMDEMAENVIKMIQAKEDPIHIIAYFKTLMLNNIHPFHDRNGGTASIMMNCILLSSDYPALPRCRDKQMKWKTSLDIQSSKNHQTALETSLRNRMQAQLSNDLCVLIRDGKVDEATLQDFLKKGTDLNLPLSKGWTTLHFACHLQRWQIAGLLLHKGADLSKKTKGGQTALDMAKKHSLEEASKLVHLTTQCQNQSLVFSKVYNDGENNIGSAKAGILSSLPNPT